MKPLFSLGRLLATPGVLAAAERAGDNLLAFFMRHELGDWGELSEHDKQANAEALRDGSRLLSAYHLKNGTKIWIITEADRSSTCVLLPEEY